MSLNCTPENTGDQYWIELLTRRDHAVPLDVASVTHTPLAAVVTVPTALLTMFVHKGFPRAPVVSPLPMMIPEDANPPEVTRLPVPYATLYGVSQIPNMMSPASLDTPRPEFRPPKWAPVVAEASRRPSGHAPASSWNHAAVPPPKSSLPRTPIALPADQRSPFFTSVIVPAPFVEYLEFTIASSRRP